jgi:hypothetical protein
MMTRKQYADIELAQSLSIIAQYSINIAAELTTRLPLTEVGKIMAILKTVETEMVDNVISANLDMK